MKKKKRWKRLINGRETTLLGPKSYRLSVRWLSYHYTIIWNNLRFLLSFFLLYDSVVEWSGSSLLCNVNSCGIIIFIFSLERPNIIVFQNIINILFNFQSPRIKIRTFDVKSFWMICMMLFSSFDLIQYLK